MAYQKLVPAKRQRTDDLPEYDDSDHRHRRLNVAMNGVPAVFKEAVARIKLGLPARVVAAHCFAVHETAMRRHAGRTEMRGLGLAEARAALKSIDDAVAALTQLDRAMNGKIGMARVADLAASLSHIRPLPPIETCSVAADYAEARSFFLDIIIALDGRFRPPLRFRVFAADLVADLKRLAPTWRPRPTDLIQFLRECAVLVSGHAPSDAVTRSVIQAMRK